MTIYQGALTVITKIKPGKADHLCELLLKIDSDVENNDLVPFKKLTTIHFARWVILPQVKDDAGNGTFPAQLVFSTNFDLPLDNHLNQLVDEARPGLDQVYDFCEGYPDRPQRTRESVLAYLRAHAVDYNIFYVGVPGVTVHQIRQEANLRVAIENFLDREGKKNGEWSGQGAGEVREAIQRFVRGEPALSWAQEPPGPPVLSLAWHGWLGLGFVTLLLLPFALIWLLLVRFHEIGDDKERSTKEKQSRRGAGRRARELEAWSRLNEKLRAGPNREHQPVQNQLSHVVVIKPGWFRQTTLKIVLKIMNFGGRYVYNQGSLLGVSTLHFVRWEIIDGGKRLLFLTNYDGSMISYVADFVNKSWQIPSALTAIWSNTVGFPKTHWLILEGARDIERFSAFLLDYHVPTQVWYSAYRRFTTGNISNNEKIRRGLFGNLNEQETIEWLRRF